MKRIRLHVPREEGFTAIELMVVVAIVAILCALAMPSFQNVIDRYRVRRATEDMTASIYFARSEAIKRGGGGVTLAKASVTGCTAPTNDNWSCGWVIFVDANGNAGLDDGEVVLQSSPVPRGAEVTISTGATGGSPALPLTAWGEFNGAGQLGISFKSVANPTNTDLQRKLCIASGGRLRVC